MSLYLNVSSSLQQLSRAFAKDLSARPKGVFEPDFIVTQTEGMNNYLRLQLAQETGISAHCRYLGPTDLILEAYRLLVDEKRPAISVPQLRWQVYRLLGEPEFGERFPRVAGYFLNSDVDRDVKRLELAEKVATLFDQYQIYRPAVIRQWNRTTPGADDWQHFLWQQVMQRNGRQLSDKTYISDAIFRALKDPGSAYILQRRMPVVYVFGISIITDYHVQLFNELAKVIDLHFYLLDPAAGVYWYEDRSEKQLALLESKGIDTGQKAAGNPLLLSWGRIVQDTFKLLFRHEAFLNAYEMLEPDAEAPDTLLGKIQDDIHRAAGKEERHRLRPEDLRDGSLTVSACYTPLREVETLYNYLVDLHSKGLAFAPQDVLVMVNDINVYGPYIRAVFQNAPYKFRYTISDESHSGGDSLIDALTAILRLNAESFRPEEVVQLLEFTTLQQRFAIDDGALVRRLVQEANIRFGFQGDKNDDTRYVSWRYGLQRIVYGVCMAGVETCASEMGEPLYPLDLVEGSEAQMAIRFAHFAEVLMQHLEERYRPRSLADWVSYVERLVNDLLADTADEVEEEVHELLNQLGSFNAAYEYMTEPITYEVFSRSLLQSLRAAAQDNLYGYGGITFCSMVPMRSIPFKVVAMLGLDHDKFPRKDTALSFNLMDRERQVGDRNLRDNDRHLFLETLLSAGERLYISYLGRKAADNTPLPPSVLVEELLDYIEAGLPDSEAELKEFTTVHPLHPFSGKYNLPGSPLKDYLRRPRKEGNSRTRDTGPEETLPIREIPLHSLMRFPKNALERWYQHKLGIRYQHTETALPDTEILGLDKLMSHNLKMELLHTAEERIEELRQKQVRTGKLPLSSMSVVVVETLREELSDLQPLIDAHILTGDRVQAVIEIDLGHDVLLKGTVEVIDGMRMTYLCLSQNETSHQMQALVQYLAAVASGKASRLEFISGVKRKAVVLEGVSPEAALQKLQQMARLYVEGHESPLAFTEGLMAHLKKTPPHIDTDHFAFMVEKAAGGHGIADPYTVQHYRQSLFDTPEALAGFVAMYEAFAADLNKFFSGK